MSSHIQLTVSECLLGTHGQISHVKLKDWWCNAKLTNSVREAFGPEFHHVFEGYREDGTLFGTPAYMQRAEDRPITLMVRKKDGKATNSTMANAYKDLMKSLSKLVLALMAQAYRSQHYPKQYTAYCGRLTQRHRNSWGVRVPSLCDGRSLREPHSPVYYLHVVVLFSIRDFTALCMPFFNNACPPDTLDALDGLRAGSCWINGE